ncbi:MAG: signal peptide peptidase SppA [Pseudomonadota bacterium]
MIRRWLGRFLAVIGFFSLLLFAGLFGLGWWAMGKFEQRTTVEVPGEVVLVADWRGGVPEKTLGFRGFAPLPFDTQLALPETLFALEQAARDPRVKGLVVLTDGQGFGLGQAQELRIAVERLEAAGKFTAVYADSLGEFEGGMIGTFLVSAFEHVQVQPLGMLGLTGLNAEQPYFGRLLDDLDVELQVEQREAFKTALESFVRSEPSPEQTVMLDRLLDRLFGELVGGIARSRELAEEDVRRAVDQGPLLGEEAREFGLIDAVAHQSALWQTVEDRTGTTTQLPLARYLRAGPAEEILPEATFGFVHAVGPIRRGSDETLGGRLEIAGDSLAAAIDAAREAQVDALVLRINSPGGSAVASETAAEAVRRVKAAGIPVVVSMGDVAASGGYWLSMDADRIVAAPVTLTGSIGVVAGKPALDGLLTRLGIDVAVERRGANAGFGSLIEPWDDRALARVDVLLDDIYQSFVDGVAAGRDLSPERVRALAGGQVWTGREALDLGLVDELGGLLDAITLAKASAGLEADAPVSLERFPGPRPPLLEALRSLDLVHVGLERAALWLRHNSPAADLRFEAAPPVLR